MMIFCTVLMVILYSNLVSSTDVEDPIEQFEKIAYGFSYHEPNEYPFYVSLQSEDPNSTTGYRHFCGGSLIERQIVLTAAHCLHLTSQIPTYRILPNYRNSPFIQDDDLTFKISLYVIHPGYNLDPVVVLNDIAVILMDQPDARVGATIKLPIIEIMPLCEPVTIMGFGRIENEVDPNELRSATVFRLTDHMCSRDNFPGSFTPVFNLCTSNAIGSGICKGDSGGPLVRRVNNNTYLQGIASTSYEPCGSFPITNFANVLAYTDFINHAILLLTRDELRSNQNEYSQHLMGSK